MAVDQREALIAAVRAQVEKERAEKQKKLEREQEAMALSKKKSGSNQEDAKKKYKTLSQEELAIKLNVVRNFSLAAYPLLTSRLKFGRSNELIKISGSLRCSCSIMSALVILSAVAVSAIIGTLGNSS